VWEKVLVPASMCKGGGENLRVGEERSVADDCGWGESYSCVPVREKKGGLEDLQRGGEAMCWEREGHPPSRRNRSLAVPLWKERNRVKPIRTQEKVYGLPSSTKRKGGCPKEGKKKKIRHIRSNELPAVEKKDRRRQPPGSSGEKKNTDFRGKRGKKKGSPIRASNRGKKLGSTDSLLTRRWGGSSRPGGRMD